MNYYMFIVALCLLGNGVAAQHLERSVLSNGAVRARAEHVTIAGTIGQPMIGVSASVSHGALHGFWYHGAPGVLTVERTHPVAVRITPQPAVMSATVEVGCSGEASATVLTVQGKRLAELELVPSVRGQAATVDCSELASGLYLVQVRCQGQEMFLPMMVAK
ncbi:MAG: hypothetical protein KatS3mg040_0037 [Candidatus Kapaibacterium sp.]|nr:MAG: hypothetical protein KatS3mg040_0037 [Candidatus Kapabacteria bacterium]